MRLVCVNVGRRYGDEWVHRLRSMVSRNLDIDFNFVCLSDHDIDGVDTVKTDKHGWWAKVDLFKPGQFPGFNMYLDLDVVITGDITPIVQRYMDTDKVIAPDDFSYSLINPKRKLVGETRRLLGGDGTVNSSVMFWSGDAGADVYTKFTEAKTKEVHGDQNWITQALWPEKLGLMDDADVCSYKYHYIHGIRPAPIVVFHGSPKVSDLPERHPLRQAWR